MSNAGSQRLYVLIAILGLLVSLSGFSLVREWDQETARLRFQILANANLAVFENQLQGYFLEADSLKQYFTYSDFVSRAEFAGFTATSLRAFPAIEAVMWVPRVAEAQRAAFEAETREHGFVIHDHRPGVPHQDIPLPRGARPVYHPILYLEPATERGFSLGYALDATPAVRALFERAAQADRAVFGASRLDIGDGHAVAHGFILRQVQTTSSYADPRSRGAAAHTGFVVLRVNLEAALKAATEHLQAQDLRIAIFDDSQGGGRRAMFSTPREPASAAQETAGAAEALRHEKALPLLGASWRIVFTPTPSYLSRHYSWNPWLVFLFGLTLTAWVLLLVGFWQRRAERMQRVVDAGAQALEKTRQQQEAILQTVADGIITIDPAGLITSFNGAAENIFGYQAREVLGKNVSLLLPANDRQEHERFTANSRLYQPRIINRARDLVGCRKDGSLFPLELNVAPYVTDSGNGYVGVLRDITERKRAEDQLRDQKEQLSDILENTDDGYLQLDWTWRVTYINTRAEELLGVRRDEVLSYDLREILPDMVSMYYKMLRTTLIDRKHQHSVVMYGPTMRYLEANSTPTRDGLIAYFRDVTQQKTAELELIKARDEAERASHAKTQYLSRMSHELRTPMNAVLGFGQLLEMDDSLTEAQRANVGEILRAGSHLLALIDEVLDLSRIEAGRYDFRYREVRISGIVLESLALVVDMARKRDIRIENTITQEHDCVVNMDEKALKQILVNLLSNAIKYNVDGGTVALSCVRGADSLRISVTDTGPGIDQALHQKLFDPFERLGREGEVEGTGVGLAVVKGLVEGMGGRIGLDSQPGAGSTFWVEFPLSTPG
jgi:PAS domain S-box-containing protein